MNFENQYETLSTHAPLYKKLGFTFLIISFVFLAVALYIGSRSAIRPELYPLFYIGVLITAVQIFLSFYIWRYIPPRILIPRNTQELLAGFRVTLTVSLFLCMGIVLFAGVASIITGYVYPPSILGGIALGAMIFHLPGKKRFTDYLNGLNR